MKFSDCNLSLFLDYLYMKKLLLSVLISMSSLSGYAQTTNYALALNGADAVQVNNFSVLNSLSEFSFQTFLYLDEWSSNAVIFTQSSGNNSISLSLGNAPQEGLLFTICNDGKSWTQALKNIQLKKWQNLSLVFNSGASDKICFYIDGKSQELVLSSQNFPLELPSMQSPLLVGNNLKGRLDEVRFWNKALTQQELSWNNTINAFHPQYDALALYWKFDQDQCENIVDYKGKYHAGLYPLMRTEVSDNANFRYRIVSGYTSFPRMIDRPYIDRNMYNMTNDLIILSAKVLPDGRIFMDYPDNRGSLTNAEYVSEYNGREGVIGFNGSGSKMDVGAETFMESPLRATPAATFEGWFFIDQWTEGAYLVRKSATDGQEISVRLGSEADKSLIVKINQYEYISKNKLKTGQWQHVAIKLNAASSRFNRKVRFQYDCGSEYYADIAPSSGTLSVLPLSDQVTTLIGENLNGKIDELMIWRSDRSEANTKVDAAKGYSYPTGEWSDILLCSYWKGDNPENPGLDSQSWTEMDKYMRSMYENKRGFKVRYGLISAEGDAWKSMIADPAKLNTLIGDIKKLLPYTDGVDIDFEWCYTQSEWNHYGNMVEKIRAAVPADKVFTCSLHAVAYKLDKKYIDMVDYFTFQIYGPSPDIWPYDRYVKAYNDFISQGYPKEKILMSIGTLATNAQKAVVGYKNVIEANPGISKDKDQALYNGSTYTFNGVNTIIKKMQFINDNDLAGSMYFDMGNDMNVANEYSLIKAMDGVVASNVDTLVTKADIETSSDKIAEEGSSLRIYPNPGTGVFQVRLPFAGGAECQVLNLDGAVISKQNLMNEETLNLTHLSKGAYLVSIKQKGKKYFNKIYIK